MGAKIPGRLKTRRPTCKCEVCGCAFFSIQALRSHQACVHPGSTKRVAYKPKIEVIARRKLVPVKKTMKPAILKPKVVHIPVEKAQSDGKKLDVGKPYNTRRTEFECPVCSKIFIVYFSAYKHIQKYHCINEEGESVDPTSADLIRPTRIEQCTLCNKRVASNQLHSCTTANTERGPARTSYSCLGCEQSFPSLHMFEFHIPGLHSDEADNFCFPDISTFKAWKGDVESQTDIKYLILSKKGPSQVYHCNHLTTNTKASHFCPSSFTVQEFSKGVQVAFFQEHFGHDSNVYQVPDRYKKYLIMLNNSEEYIVPKTKDRDEVNEQFTKLMNNILVSSEKIDVNGLKILLGKALEMMTILKRYDEPIHAVDVNKSITDDEITKLLDKPVRKRKVEVPEDSIAKRLRKDSITIKTEPEIKEEPKLNKELKTYSNPKKLSTPKSEDNKKDIQSPSSFNESYKNFVDASYNITVEKPKSRNKLEMKKKEIVKTRVGQFKPSLSPKENVKPIIKDNKPTVTKEVRFKEINLPKLKPDFEYEVREQDSDCNILIIKIKKEIE